MLKKFLCVLLGVSLVVTPVAAEEVDFIVEEETTIDDEAYNEETYDDISEVNTELGIVGEDGVDLIEDLDWQDVEEPNRLEATQVGEMTEEEKEAARWFDYSLGYTLDVVESYLPDTINAIATTKDGKTFEIPLEKDENGYYGQVRILKEVFNGGIPTIDTLGWLDNYYMLDISSYGYPGRQADSFNLGLLENKKYDYYNETPSKGFGTYYYRKNLETGAVDLLEVVGGETTTELVEDRNCLHGYIYQNYKIRNDGVKVKDGNTFEIGEKGNHTYGEWVVVKAATTEEAGLERRVCSVDNTHFEEREIPKLPKQEVKESETGSKTTEAPIVQTKEENVLKVSAKGLKNNKLKIKKGKSVKLKVSGVSGAKGKAKFKTSNKKVATVSKKGKIVAKKKGTCKITVKVGKFKKVIKVTVK